MEENEDQRTSIKSVWINLKPNLGDQEKTGKCWRIDK
jgi:hypothetical protein